MLNACLAALRGYKPGTEFELDDLIAAMAPTSPGEPSRPTICAYLCMFIRAGLNVVACGAPGFGKSRLYRVESLRPWPVTITSKELKSLAMQERITEEPQPRSEQAGAKKEQTQPPAEARSFSEAMLRTLGAYEPGRRFTMADLAVDIERFWKRNFDRKQIASYLSSVMRAGVGVELVRRPGNFKSAIYGISPGGLAEEFHALTVHKMEKLARAKKGPPQRPGSGKDRHVLLIDFAEHNAETLYKDLCELADEEVRTPAQEAIYLLKKAMCHNGFVLRRSCEEFEVKQIAD